MIKALVAEARLEKRPSQLLEKLVPGSRKDTDGSSCPIDRTLRRIMGRLLLRHHRRTGLVVRETW